MRARGSDPCRAMILIRDTLRFQALQPFGPRVVAIQVAGVTGPMVFISAYIRHTSGEGLSALAASIRQARKRCPRIVVGMDGNGHSPWWGPAHVIANPVGMAIEDMIMELDLVIANSPPSAASFLSDTGGQSWIDVTLATPSGAHLIANWRVDPAFFTGSDHQAIFFAISEHALQTEIFRCRAWDEVNWTAFAATVSQECHSRGLLPPGPSPL